MQRKRIININSHADIRATKKNSLKKAPNIAHYMKLLNNLHFTVLNWDLSSYQDEYLYFVTQSLHQDEANAIRTKIINFLQLNESEATHLALIDSSGQKQIQFKLDNSLLQKLSEWVDIRKNDLAYPWVYKVLEILLERYNKEHHAPTHLAYSKYYEFFTLATVNLSDVNHTSKHLSEIRIVKHTTWDEKWSQNDVKLRILFEMLLIPFSGEPITKIFENLKTLLKNEIELLVSLKTPFLQEIWETSPNEKNLRTAKHEYLMSSDLIDAFIMCFQRKIESRMQDFTVAAVDGMLSTIPNKAGLTSKGKVIPLLPSPVRNNIGLFVAQQNAMRGSPALTCRRAQEQACQAIGLDTVAKKK